MIKKLWIQNFRGFEETLLDFGGSKNIVIYGDNNQGKTNFLECIYFLANGMSFREKSNAYLVRFGQSQSYIGMEYQSQSDVYKIYFKILSNGNRLGTVNQKLIPSNRFLKELIPVEYISSDIIRIFQESPDYRRSDIDKFCSLYFPEYRKLLKNYERVIRQKNFQLKNMKRNCNIDVWNEQLSTLSYQLVFFRMKVLGELQVVLADCLAGVFPEFYREISLEYQLKGVQCATFSRETYVSELKQLCDQSFDKEVEAGVSLFGAHRDDFFIQIRQKDLKRFFSRGVNRTLAFFLKVSQLLLLSKKTHLVPVLLLDDSFAEVDYKNKEKIFEVLKGKFQIFYTSVSKDDHSFFDQDRRLFRISEGIIYSE